MKNLVDILILNQSVQDVSVRWWTIVLIIMVTMVLTASMQAAAFDIVRDGKAVAVIVIPDDAYCSVQRAAAELQYHVKKASGATLEIAKESAKPGNRQSYIYLGAGKAAKEMGITADALAGLARNGFIRRTVGNNLFLVGRDQPGTWIAKDWIEMGTLSAVYYFLSEEMGVRWLWPGELGEVIPRQSTINIKAYDKTVAPPLRSSRIHPSWRALVTGWTSEEARKKFAEDEALWEQRHGFAWDGSLRSQHAFPEHWERFGKTHPEFFNMLPDGTRRPDPLHVTGGAGSYVGMCPSEPGLWQQIIKDWKVRRVEGEPRWAGTIFVGENDTLGSCVCQRCLSWDVPDPDLRIPWDKRLDYAKRDFAAGKRDWNLNLGSVSDRYARFYMEVYKLAREIDPNVLIIGFAYANYLKPPLEVKLNENIVICFVGSLMYPWTTEKVQEFKDDWSDYYDIGATMVLRPNFMLDGHNLPIFIARKFADLFAFCYGKGMIGTEFDSNTGQYGVRGPDMYVMARMHRAIDKPVDEILDEYYQAFGPAETYIREYFALWERLADDPATLEPYKGKRVDPLMITEVTAWNRFYMIANEIFTPEIMAQGWEILDKALVAAKDDSVAKARVEFLRKGFKNAELTLAAQRAYDSGDKFKLGKAVAALDAYRALIEGYNVANMAALASMENIIWDRPLLKAMHELPGEPLPDKWKFMWDPNLKGLNEEWYADGFDSSKWHDIGIDGPWEQQPVGKKWKAEHDGIDYDGIAWYRNVFTVKPEFPDRKHSVRLTFGAVDEACTIWVNGIKVLDRPYPYKGDFDSWRTPFVVDISEVVRFDKPNTLAVRVEDNAGAGGIWRPVWLAYSELPAVDAVNLIRNGGFEEIGVGWLDHVWSGSFRFTYDHTQVHSGEHSGMIECISIADEAPDIWHRGWGRWFQTGIQVEPGKKYRFRAWVRTDKDFSGGIRLWVLSEGMPKRYFNLPGTDGLWSEVVIENIVPQSKTVDIYLNVLASTCNVMRETIVPGSKVWFDDVELVTVAE